MRRLRAYKSRGLTLVELMVAMTLALLVALAAIAALLISQQGFHAVDAASQLRDNARFATDLIRRVVLQAGFLNTEFAVDRGHEFTLSASDTEPNLKGFNNARYNQALAIGTTNTVSSSGQGINGSDMLVVRYQIGSTQRDGVADGSMINCAGMTESTIPTNSSERLTSVFHIGTSATSNEPSLMCTRRVESTGTWATAQPLIQGVETFQILYGTHGVIPNTAPSALSESSVSAAAERYLRADQLIVNGDAAATNANWARVRSVRIGMVLRGPVGSAPMGEAMSFDSLGGGGFSSSDDKGSVLSINPADGRLRQTVSFTIHLRNPQETL